MQIYTYIYFFRMILMYLSHAERACQNYKYMYIYVCKLLVLVSVGTIHLCLCLSSHLNSFIRTRNHYVTKPILSLLVVAWVCGKIKHNRTCPFISFMHFQSMTLSATNPACWVRFPCTSCWSFALKCASFYVKCQPTCIKTGGSETVTYLSEVCSHRSPPTDLACAIKQKIDWINEQCLCYMG